MALAALALFAAAKPRHTAPGPKRYTDVGREPWLVAFASRAPALRGKERPPFFISAGFFQVSDQTEGLAGFCCAIGSDFSQPGVFFRNQKYSTKK